MSRAAAMAFCVTGVPIILAFLIWWSFGTPLSAFRPFINDEVTYWHQALTFGQAGFGGGYYTSAEIANPSGFTPFGAHGPGFPVIYGLFATVFSWELYSPVVANLAFISLATWLCVSVTRAGRARALLVATLLVTFWPLLLWAPTAMQEALHHAGAIAMAGCMAGALASTPSRTAQIAGWPLLALLGFIRPSWLLLMPVWAAALTWRRQPRTIVVTFVASVVLSAAIFAAYTRTTAPTAPGFFFLRAAGAETTVAALWDNIRGNVALAMSLGDYEPFEVLFRLQYWGWLVCGAIALGAATVPRASRATVWMPHVLAGATAMAGAMTFMLVLYTFTNAAEHRVLSAFLLLAAVLAAVAPGKTGPMLAAVLIASNLATTTLFLHALKEERQDNFVWDHRGYRTLDSVLREHGVAFRAGEPRWCNTLLTSQFPPFLTAVPGGVGISVVREPEVMQLPAKSRYLLLDDRALAVFAQPPRTQPLATLPYGTLYLNLDAECR